MTQIRIRLITAALLAATLLAPSVVAQPALLELMQRHGVTLPARGIEGAFDDWVEPAIAVVPGSLAVPLAMLATATGKDQIAAAYAFGVLAGRSGKAADPAELAAAGQVLLQLVTSDDRRARIAGARVAGRVFAASFDDAAISGPPPGLADALFSMLNRSDDTDQLAAMDALGLVREAEAVTALTDRYRFYRDTRLRPLAGGALEALARIGDPSTTDLVRLLVTDEWAGGKDATALAVAFARQRLLNDGSIVAIQQALGDKARRAQARAYLAELGAPAP